MKKFIIALMLCFVSIALYSTDDTPQVSEPDSTAINVDTVQVKDTMNCEPVKVLENGQIIIIKNGVKYNAIGQQLSEK